jgi:transcriptional regulator with XRE-family HTH domain
VTVNEASGAEWVAIGDRLRAARESARISVRELARRVAVSPSHVSQVERGLASFSVRALYNVTSELGISMDSLFDDASPALEVASGPVLRDGPSTSSDPLADNGIVLRARHRPTIPLAGGTRWERLTPRPEAGAEFKEVIYPPAPVDGPRAVDYVQHSGREYGVVISGTLTVQVGFDTTQLHAGDSIAFDSAVPHRFWNETQEEVHAVWLDREAPYASTDGQNTDLRTRGH